jgi:hypothetical protein
VQRRHASSVRPVSRGKARCSVRGLVPLSDAIRVRLSALSGDVTPNRFEVCAVLCPTPHYICSAVRELTSTGTPRSIHETAREVARNIAMMGRPCDVAA